MPFIVIIGVFFIVFYGWNSINNYFLEGQRSSQNDRAFLSIETGSAKAMTVGGKEWINAPNNIYLYSGESLKTGLDGRATLELFDESIIRLNTKTEITLNELKKKDEETHIAINLKKGQLWVNIKSERTKNSTFLVSTGNLNIKANGTIFAVSEPDRVYIIQGNVKTEIKNKGKKLKSFDIGVGQQLVVNSESINALANGESPEFIFAMSDSFKESNWYRWNRKKDGALIADISETTSKQEAETVAEITNTETTAPIADDTAMDNTLTDENLAVDNKAPKKPVIESPGTDADIVNLDDIVQNITGRVSKDTEKVIVNDYVLSKYVPGSETFRYTANYAFKNLKSGDNEYKVYAEDKAGNRSEPAIITLVLSQDVIDEKTAENDPTFMPDATSIGGVTITTPNNGESFSTSETSFDISGKVPEGTTKVVVNDYILQAFSEGDSTYTYKASAAFKNLDIGKVNRYKVTAYSAENKEIGSATISIDVESSSEIQIIMPTDKSSYSTSLNELVIGGTVGKWAQKVFVNGKLLRNYIPGSGEWKTTVALSQGKNIFDVRSTKENVTTGTDSISITYRP